MRVLKLPYPKRILTNFVLQLGLERFRFAGNNVKSKPTKFIIRKKKQKNLQNADYTLEKKFHGLWREQVK